MKTTLPCQLIEEHFAKVQSKYYIDALTDGYALVYVNEYNKEKELDTILREINMIILPDNMLALKVGFNNCLADDSGTVDTDKSVMKIKIIDFDTEEEPVYAKIESKEADLSTLEIYKIDRFEPQDTCMKARYRSDAPTYKNGMGLLFESTGIALCALREDTPMLSSKSEFEGYVFGTGNLFSDYMKIERRHLRRKARKFKTNAQS